MEVSARQYFSGVGEHERVVGNRVGLDQQRRGDMAHLVEACAHYLRLAAEAVRVLHAMALRVRCADRAALEQLAIDARRIDLPAMAANGLDTGVERHIAAKARIDG